MNALFRLLRISCADRSRTQRLLVDSYKQNAFGKNILEPLFQGVFHSLTFAPYIRFVTSLCLRCNFGEARFARVNRFRMKLSPMKHFGAPRFLSNTHRVVWTMTSGLWTFRGCLETAKTAALRGIDVPLIRQDGAMWTNKIT